MQEKFGMDGNIVQKTEPVLAENWRKEVEGLYISFKETQKHIVTFLEEIPTKCVISFRERQNGVQMACNGGRGRENTKRYKLQAVTVAKGF